MPTFTSYDGTELTATVLGAPGEPVVVLPGGPLRHPRYLGTLGGLDAHRELVLLELPRRRVDQLVGDVEALRKHLGRDTVDLVAHSAGGNLALLYAAAHPQRVRRLALITPGSAVAGIVPDQDEWQAALRRRNGEPWFDDALRAILAWDAGDDSAANRAAAQPFFYGRWDEAAREHAAGAPDELSADAQAVYLADGAFDVDATRAGLATVRADVLIMIGELDPAPGLAAGQALSELFVHADVVVQPGAGHFPWLDDPGRFATTLARFFAYPA